MNKSPHPPRTLRLLFWESTAACNLSCIHCRRLDTRADDELTTAEFRTVLDSAASLGRPVIVFSGGEPLLRDDWRQLAEYARSLDLPIALATNGTLIDAALAEQIAQTGFSRVAVSLDGADHATHDAFRGDGTFDRAITGLRLLRLADQPVQINASIAAHNVHQLDALYDLAESLHAEALHLFLLVPVGCGRKIAASHQLPPQQYEQVLQWICDRQADSPAFELKATCAPHYMRLAAQRGIKPRSSRGCLAGVGVVFVSCRGEVFPCGYLPVKCGSVREQSLADIWRNSPDLKRLADSNLLKGKCGRCEYKSICAGCRARAFAETGDYLAEEPNCLYQPS